MAEQPVGRGQSPAQDQMQQGARHHCQGHDIASIHKPLLSASIAMTDP